MTITIGGGMQNFAYPTGYTGPGSKPASDAFGSTLDRALEDFKKVATQTPAERARDEVLKKHGLDEKAYTSLQADARKALDQEIADAVKRAAGVEKRGTIVDRMG